MRTYILKCVMTRNPRATSQYPRIEELKQHCIPIKHLQQLRHKVIVKRRIQTAFRDERLQFAEKLDVLGVAKQAERLPDGNSAS